MSDMREHFLTFELVAGNWAEAERMAAQVIREYTLEHRRGRGAVSDEVVLRDAVFRASPADDHGNWRIAVEVRV